MMISSAPAEETQAGDPAQGRKLSRQCRTCHGLDGVARIPIAPHIGGESVSYLRHQLEAFRSGAREHEMMTVVAKGLSDEAIADLAAWYSSIRPLATPPAAHADASSPPEECAGCHGLDGIAIEADAPHLAGESAIYIQTQLKAFRIGKREHEIMNSIAADLSDRQITDYARWYAAIGFETQLPEPTGQ